MDKNRSWPRTDVEDHVQVRVLQAGVVVGARLVGVLVRRVRQLRG